MPDAFLFVPHTFGSHEKREKELNYAAAKAHVAKRAHAKHRNLKHSSGLTRGNVVPQVQHLSNVESIDAETQNEKSRLEADSSGQNVPNGQSTLSKLAVPRPVRNCGNDPFLPLVADHVPQLNRAMDFVQFNIRKSWSSSFMLRSLNKDSANTSRTTENKIGSLLPSWLWNLWITDGGSYMCSIIAAVPLLIRVTPATEQVPLQKMALQLKQGSYRALRNGLRNLETSNDFLLILAFYVKAMFREASLTGDIAAAKWHAQMLEGLITRLAESSSDMKHLFRLAYWSDAVPALFQLRRPIVKYTSWMPQIVTPLGKEAHLVMPNSDSVDTDIAACVLSQVSRAAILHTRKAMFISNKIADGDMCDCLQEVEVLLLWMATAADYHICELLDFYHALVNYRSCASLSAGERYMETSIALALMHILQKSFGDLLSPSGIDLHESAAAVLPALLEAITQARIQCSRSERLFYRDAELWILFIGAHAEQRLWRQKPTSNTLGLSEQNSETWFHTELRKSASDAGLDDWAVAEAKFEKFVFNPNIEPHPSTWYQGVIHGIPDLP